MLEGEHPARAAEAGHHLVDAEERPVAAAELLRSREVAVRRQVDALALHRLDEEERHVLAPQFGLERLEVAERNLLAPGQQRLEARLELLVAVHRGCAERQSVETVLGGEDARASGRRAPELDCRLDRLAAGAREQAALDSAAGEPGQRLGEQAGEQRRPQREHPRRLERERLGEGRANPRVVPAGAVHPEAPEQVEVARAVGVVEIRALRTCPGPVEADRPQDPHELRVDGAGPEVEILAAPRVEQRAEAEVAHRG